MSTSTRALIILADGFEEIEAVAVIDILRRGGVKVTISSLDFKLVTGAHDLLVKADCLVDDLPDYDFDMLILPGGEPGTTNLENNEDVQRMIRRYTAEGKWVAAICNAPRILDRAGLLAGKDATSYPAAKPEMKQCSYKEDSVVIDGNIVTSRAPGTAMAFGYTLLDCLGLEEKAAALKEGMLHSA